MEIQRAHEYAGGTAAQQESLDVIADLVGADCTLIVDTWANLSAGRNLNPGISSLLVEIVMPEGEPPRTVLIGPSGAIEKF